MLQQDKTFEILHIQYIGFKQKHNKSQEFYYHGFISQQLSHQPTVIKWYGEGGGGTVTNLFMCVGLEGLEPVILHGPCIAWLI